MRKREKKWLVGKKKKENDKEKERRKREKIGERKRKWVGSSSSKSFILFLGRVSVVWKSESEKWKAGLRKRSKNEKKGCKSEFFTAVHEGHFGAKYLRSESAWGESALMNL